MGISSSAPWLKYYDSTPAHLDYPKKTIYEMVRAAADKYPKNIAYEFMGKKTTFAEFMERIDRTAKAYLDLYAELPAGARQLLRAQPHRGGIEHDPPALGGKRDQILP